MARKIAGSRQGSWRRDKALWRLQPTLSRLANQKSGTISASTYDSLRELLFRRGNFELEDADDLADELSASLLTPGAQVLEYGYAIWQNERIRHRFFFNGGSRWRMTQVGIHELDGSKVPPLDTRDLLWGELSGLAADRYREYRALQKHCASVPKVAARLQRFLQKCDANGVDITRVAIAELRILEPMLESAESAFVERDWRELTELELEAFVRHGIGRERILLDRERDAHRVTHIIERGPLSA